MKENNSAQAKQIIRQKNNLIQIKHRRRSLYVPKIKHSFSSRSANAYDKWSNQMLQSKSKQWSYSSSNSIMELIKAKANLQIFQSQAMNCQKNISSLQKELQQTKIKLCSLKIQLGKIQEKLKSEISIQERDELDLKRQQITCEIIKSDNINHLVLILKIEENKEKISQLEIENAMQQIQYRQRKLNSIFEKNNLSLKKQKNN